MTQSPRTKHAIVVAALCAMSGLTAAAPDGKAARFYENALTRYEQHDVRGAIIQLKNALQIDRGLLPVHVLLGKALLANGEAAAAEVAFHEALRLGVNRAEVIVPLAQAAIAQGKQKQVLDDPRYSVGALPVATRGALLLQRSAAASDMGDVAEALRAIDEARTANPNSADVWLAEVPVRIRARQFEQAGVAAGKALGLDSNNANAWYQRGAVLHVQGDRSGALGAYDRALKIDAGHVESRVSRAGLALDSGQLAEAARDVAELRRRSPKEPRGAYLRALLAERDGQHAEARAALQQVTALIDPVQIDFIRYRPQVLMLGGLAHFGLGEREKAKPYLETYQRVHGPSAVSKLLAQVYLGENNVDRAIEMLEGYLRVQPGDTQALALLASSQMSQGRHARATALMQQALATRESPELRTALGLSLLGGGQSASAIGELESALQKDPRQTQAGAALVGLYLQQGRMEKALATANGLVTQQPANAGFVNLLGIARARSGDAAGARAAFEQAVQIDPRFTAPRLQLARLDIEAGADEAAVARIGALLQHDEKNVDALMAMAHLNERRQRPTEARRWLEKAAAVSPSNELRPGLALVDFNMRSRQPAAALASARALEAKAPSDLGVLLALARAQLAASDAAGARSTLANATRIAAFDAKLQLEIAGLQGLAGNWSGAAYSLQKSLAAEPDFLPAQAMMAEIELRQGDVEKAEQRARQIAQRKPRAAIGFSLIGDIALARGQTAAAIESYRRAHQMEPTTATLLRLFEASTTQPAAAKSGFAQAEQWIKHHPKDRAVQHALADAYARTGNLTAARAGYEKLIELDPNDAAALNNLANILIDRNDSTALKFADRAMTLDPANADLIDTAGWAAFRAGQPDRALQLLRDARLREPGKPEIRYHLAAVLAHVGRRQEAREEIEAALAIGRSFEQTAAAETLRNGLR